MVDARMQTTYPGVKLPILISSALVIPWMILEWVNRRGYNEGYPFALFMILWLLPAVFVWLLLPLVNSLRSGKSIFAKPLLLLLRIAGLVLIAVVWSGMLVDQMPCFLGVPLCD